MSCMHGRASGATVSIAATISERPGPKDAWMGGNLSCVMHIRMYVHQYIYRHMHMYVYMYILRYVCTYIRTYVRTYVRNGLASLARNGARFARLKNFGHFDFRRDIVFCLKNQA